MTLVDGFPGSTGHRTVSGRFRIASTKRVSFSVHSGASEQIKKVIGEQAHSEILLKTTNIGLRLGKTYRQHPVEQVHCNFRQSNWRHHTGTGPSGTGGHFPVAMSGCGSTDTAPAGQALSNRDPEMAINRFWFDHFRCCRRRGHSLAATRLGPPTDWL